MHGKVILWLIRFELDISDHCFLSFLFYFRFPNDRPSVGELQIHPFFKQCKRTTLAENLKLTGLDKYNCNKKATGTFFSLCCKL